MTIPHRAFARLSALAAERLPGDPARRQHVAATLGQLSHWARDCEPCSLAVLGAGYELLGAKSSADPATQARRKTCRELAALCRQEDGRVPVSAEHEAIAEVAEIWEVLAQVASGAQPRDGRTEAMAARFREELATLRAVAPDQRTASL